MVKKIAPITNQINTNGRFPIMGKVTSKKTILKIVSNTPSIDSQRVPTSIKGK